MSNPRPRRAICSTRTVRRQALAIVAGSAIALLGASVARAGDNPVFIQWFETSWNNIENRMPDAFMAGYGSTWLPPIWKASDGSAGFDTFDRFDIGSPTAPTMYGTEAYFRQMVKEFQNASILVYPDLIMNHNGARTSNAAFLADGGWPGFYIPATGANFWGDFHDGTKQSQDPGSANYDLWTGDLVSLIDIAQESNFSYIRHPTTTNPLNIPPGNVRNRPNPANARFYPDTTQTPLTFTNNPSTFQGFTHGDGRSWTVYPINPNNPNGGTPYAENATGLLMRSVQWMLDDVKVDGFRLDAAKHVPQWFWDNYFDPIVFNRRVTASGARVTPYSFGESVAGNSFVQTYIRKDGFGNRDALDLNEAGQLRDILNARGLGSWTNVLSASIDNQDNGFNDGTQGVHHVFSHDNGSVGNGGSAPALPSQFQQGLVQNAYVLFRSGPGIVYHNSREMHTRFSGRGFWPREGNPTALGNPSTTTSNDATWLTQLVKAHNSHVRGSFFVLNSTDTVNSSLNDVIVFERSNGTASNVLVGLNDSYSNGFQQRSIQTTFPPGTRLTELSGTAADPVVNLGGNIPQILTVDSNRRVLLTIPNNKNSSGVEHNRGYVVYGMPVPAATMTVSPVASTIAADPSTVATFKRRLTPIEVVTAPTFEIRIDTTKANDPGETNNANFDDFACFRIDQGYVDYNANGAVDLTGGTVDLGFERFLTQNSPISGPSGNGVAGIYRQSINTAQLSEGLHYITANVYRRRTDGGLAVFNELRKVIYVDRSPPSVTLLDTLAAVGNGNFEFRVQANDRTTSTVYIIPNIPNVASLSNAQIYSTYAVSGNAARQYDRLEFRRNVGNLPAGNNTMTVIAVEPSGNYAVTTYTGITVQIGSGDVNRDGTLDINDLYSSWTLTSYQQEADVNRNNGLDLDDRVRLESLLRPTELRLMRGSQR